MDKIEEDMDQMFTLLDEIIKLGEEIKHCIDDIESNHKLRRIKMIRELMAEIMVENEIEDKENDDENN